ncbi:MAG: response regulator, partial [Candidatus Scalindua sp.]|nr:response regulator [Candidatus Scalindua sp.]
MNAKPKILIIDDDKDLCESILDIVELESYSVDTSHTAADGLKKIENNFYNIVLLDMELPESDGLTVLGKIKEVSTDTEVIIFTAYAEMDTVIAAMDKDAFSFLPKPFEIPYILTTIKRALKKQQLLHENRILYQKTIDEEREWEDTFDSISDLVSIHDKNLKIIRCNKAVKEKLNIEYRDIIGKKCHEAFYGNIDLGLECPFVRCMETMQPESTEEECLGGTFIMSCYPRFDKTGQFNGVVHIARDITARKQVEHAMNTLVATATKNEGEEFFEQVVSGLCDWLNVDCVILSQLV